MKKTIICSALAILGIKANAQVDDVSVTLSPTASYNWFDNSAAIKDGLMVGGRVGFGFGEYFELRGIYEKSVDLKNTVEDLNLSKDIEDKFESRDVDVERWGGEVKANIPSGGYLAPYLTLGTGVQKLKVDDLKDEQIYLTAGLGIKVNLSDRIVLNLEGKNTAFNLNKTNVLYNPNAKDSEFEKAIEDSKDTRMYNWSALAGLQFYLGGREPGKLSDLDRAYLRKFSGGLSGFKFVVEPGGAYVDFNKDLGLRDTYLVGGSAGFDFSQYVGLRAFYYQSTQDKKFKKFDDLSMYGGDLYAKLNIARGITPYLTFGGGYINVYENEYEPKQGKIAEDSYFVKGGLGVVVPVSRYFDLFGAANLIYTTNKDAENLDELQDPSDLKQSKMYNVGIRLKLGAPADTEDALQDRIDEASGTNKYKARIKELEKELKEAYRDNDSDRAVEVIKEKQKLERSSKSESSDDNVRLTPEELQDLVEKTIDEVNSEYNQKSSQDNKEDVNQRIDRLERLLLQVNRSGYNNYQGNSKDVQASASNQILQELRTLNAKVDQNANQLAQLNGQDQAIIVTPQGAAPAQQVQPNQSTEQVQDNQQVSADNNVTPAQTVSTEEGNTGVVKSLFVNEGISVDAGAVIGESVAPAIGIRGHYGFTNSNFELQPSLYLGFGDEGGFGVNANAIYKFNFQRGPVVHPYIGAGIGYNSLDDDSSFGANLVVGTSFDVLNGKLYFDYSALNLAKFNKVSVGYKFGF